MKYYVLATASSYIYDFWLYCGKNSARNTDTKSIVLEFTEVLPKLPYRIFADSYYGSVDLAQELNNNGFLFIISCNKNRPAFLFSNGMHTEKNVKKGESRWCSNGRIAAMYFKDNAKVNFLTNMDVMVHEKDEKGNPLPKLVSTYRKYMGNVDRADSILSNCRFQHRNRKWTDAHFKTCLKMCVDNAWIIFRAKTDVSVPLQQFMRKLASEIVKQYETNNPQSVEQSPKTEASLLHVPLNMNKRKRCEINACKTNDLKSKYICTGCGNFLHVDCFYDFHFPDTKSKK